MRWPVCGLILLAQTWLAASPSAQQVPHWQDCGNSRLGALNAWISACMVLAQGPRASGQERPVTYYQRGDVWLRQREYDRAIADFTEAIRLDRSYMLAYHGRGVAWSLKGEFDRAIEDFTEAIRIN